MKKFAIIVAGGQGIRMQGALPKQFLELSGEPVLAHTLRRFHLPDVHLILVMHPDYLVYWSERAAGLTGLPAHQLVSGGTTRGESVRNGLQSISEEGLVAVHDAVRPVFSPGLVQRLYEEALQHGSAIPVVPVKDTLRRLTNEGSTTVPRDQYRAVQTPQVFLISRLKAAFQHAHAQEFTDEASLVEAAGFPVHLSAGEENNIKITVPADLPAAAALLREI